MYSVSVFGSFFIPYTSYIQCPPKVWRQSYRKCSKLCCYYIFICIRTKQKHHVNDFYMMFKLYINAKQTCEGIVKIYLCLMFLKFQKHKCFHKINIGCNGTKNNLTFSRAYEPLTIVKLKILYNISLSSYS